LTDISTGKNAGTNDLYPRFTTDGARIIFINTSNTGLGQQDVYIMQSDGSNRTLLFNDGTMPDSFD
jgi:TolB protein